MTGKKRNTFDELATLPGVKKTESSDTCKVVADVTGFYANEVAVTALDNMLIIELSSKHQQGQSYYLGEVEEERQLRSIPLDFAPDPESVMTHFNNGKLEVLVQKVGYRQAQPTATAA